MLQETSFDYDGKLNHRKVTHYASVCLSSVN